MQGFVAPTKVIIREIYRKHIIQVVPLFAKAIGTFVMKDVSDFTTSQVWLVPDMHVDVVKDKGY